MPRLGKRFVLSTGIAAICLSWISCGAGDPPRPCQGTTCVPSPSTFLYMTALDNISGFKPASSGTLGTSFQNLSGPNSSLGVVADPSGKFLYVSDFDNSTVLAFAINHSTGTLTPIAGSPFAVSSSTDATGIAMDPHGKFLYVALGNSNQIAGFAIDAATGALMPIVGSPFATGATPVQLIVEPTGKFLYGSNLNDPQGGISAYTIDPSSGALNIIGGSPFATQANFPGPFGLALGGAGKFLYVAMVGTVNANNVVSAFSIDPTTGVLTSVAGSPFPAGQGPLRVSSDPAGKLLFTANLHDDTITAFTINASSGALTQVAGSPLPTHSAPFDIVVDPAGKFVYVANSGSGDITVFSLDSNTGALAPVSGSPFTTGQQEPGGLAIVKTQ